MDDFKLFSKRHLVRPAARQLSWPLKSVPRFECHRRKKGWLGNGIRTRMRLRYCARSMCICMMDWMLSARAEGRNAGIRCDLFRGLLCGTNLTLDFQTLLTQHSLVSATINLWQCSAFHQSGHSKWPIWSISTHPFSERRCNNSVADGVPCGFSFFVANRPARLKAVVQASALSGFFMQPFHNRLRGAISHAARRHIDIILLFPCNRLIEKLGDPSGFNLVLDQRHPP